MLGDEPLPPPAKVTVWSEDRGFFVESVPNGETTLYRMPASQAIWKIPGWHRSVFVSNVGVVAIGYEGLNLIPLNYKPSMVLIELWRDGRLTYQTRLNSVIPNSKHLQRSASHYYWGYIVGFNKSNLLEVVTVEGKFTIDPQDGRLQK